MTTAETRNQKTALHENLISSPVLKNAKFNNLKVKSVKSNLKYTESKLEKKDHTKRKKT